jgi:hypothetical protein
MALVVEVVLQVHLLVVLVLVEQMLEMVDIMQVQAM